MVGQCAILINTCPKYKQLAISQIILLRRYSEELKWPIFIASTGFLQEEIAYLESLNITVIVQTEEDGSDFIKSRIHALKLLPAACAHVLALQDDFLVDRPVDYVSLDKTLLVMLYCPDVVGCRLMPCPPPKGSFFKDAWQIIDPTPDCYFTFQATIWRRQWLIQFFERMIELAPDLHAKWPDFTRNQFWLLANPCERDTGMRVAQELGGFQIGWPRVGPWANAVYKSPWPYRPTAIEKGVLQPWARELLEREQL